MFSLNIISNGLWNFIFLTNTKIGFVLSLVDVIFMLYSCCYMMMKSTRAKVSTCEWIVMRCGFTIYAAWVSAATILNVAYMLKAFDFADPDIPVDEETMTVIILWVALVIYNVATYLERNPLFGGVFIWVILAIHHNIVNNKSELEKIENNSVLIGMIHCISMFGFTTYLAIEYFSDYKVDNWYFGLFY